MSKVDVWHCTSPQNLKRISESGYIRNGSYVTTHRVTNLTAFQRTEILCLDDHEKGKCACECAIHLDKLRVPIESAQTCRGYPQYKIKEDLSIGACSCQCEGESGGNSGAGAVVVVGLLVVGALSLLATLFGTRR